MSQRIENAFARIRGENRAALIPFLMGYDPDAATTAAVLDILPAAGADIIEIGMPFSDPMADGPVIQAAGTRALAAGGSVAGILALVRAFRANHPETPIILMGYYNPVYRYGADTFCHDAAKAGVDGVILVDLPPEEEQEITPHLAASGLKLIRLAAPTSGDARLSALSASASGFIYYISVTGITGAKSADAGALKKQVEHVKQFTKLPVAVGFGIRTSAQVREFAAFADAVVVGSALVEAMARAHGLEDKVQAVRQFIGGLTEGLKR